MNFDIIHKSYDIRGIYGSEIDEEMYYELGYAFATLKEGANTFAIGCDARMSSFSLKEAMISGILDAGKNVKDLGLCSTDMIYFASGEYDDVDVGLMITASHNPKEYNGLKSCSKNAVPINMKSFGKDVKEFIMNHDFSNARGKRSGIYEVYDASDDFVEHIASFVEIEKLKKFKIVADAGNGVAGVFMEKLAEKLDFELIPMFFEPDGNFPHHHPSPIEPENVEDLIIKVKETKADIGVAFDGDADRMYICDEKGTIWSGTITTAMIAKVMLDHAPGKKIIYNAVCGNIVPETILANGGIPVKEKVGHVYFKESMAADEDIIFGGEHSGHYYFRKNWNADSGVIAFVVVLQLLSSAEKNPSVVREEFEKYLAIPEINSKVSDVALKLSELKDEFQDGKQDEFDGLTVRYDDWWFNVRPSSNEPLLRLNVEAADLDFLNKKKDYLLDLISR